jgi:UPF0755 protein
MWRHVASNALTLFVVLLVALGGLIGWGQRQYVEPGPLAQAICLQVPRGGSMARVSDDLAAQGAVTHPAIFRIGADYEGRADQLKFGSYLISPGASMQEIVRVVTVGGRSTCGTEINFRIGVTTAEVVLRELDPDTGRYVEVVGFEPGADVPAEYAAAVEQADVRYRVTLAEGVTSWQVVQELMQADFLTGEVAEVPPEGSLAPDS